MLVHLDNCVFQILISNGFHGTLLFLTLRRLGEKINPKWSIHIYWFDCLGWTLEFADGLCEISACFPNFIRLAKGGRHGFFLKRFLSEFEKGF